jgi:pyridoxal phosphate enzyme (YggS family)
VYSDIPKRLAEVRDRIANAAGRAGRRPDDVRLIAVSKTHPIEAVRAAAAAGQIDFGENKVQEALQKIAQSTDTTLKWHLIGHLQSNKARKAAGAVGAIHAIDSVELLKRVDQAASEASRTVDVLIQVDLALEDTKHGASVGEVPAIVKAAGDCTAVTLTGLMLLPPLADNPEDARPWFRRLRALRDELVDSGVAADRLRELSMGMSHDFEVAIAEGATMVRVGTAIFGERPPGITFERKGQEV